MAQPHDGEGASVSSMEWLYTQRRATSSRVGSFCDGLRFVLHLLRRTQPGCQGEQRREAQAQPVCFVLHDYEKFAQRSKQTLLYSLYDLAQVSLSFRLSRFRLSYTANVFTKAQVAAPLHSASIC